MGKLDKNGVRFYNERHYSQRLRKGHINILVTFCNKPRNFAVAFLCNYCFVFVPFFGQIF